MQKFFWILMRAFIFGISSANQPSDKLITHFLLMPQKY